MNIKFNINAKLDNLIDKARMNEAQIFFTNEVARLSDPYIPMDTGTLKNSKYIKKDSITYNTPYARRQYYEHKGSGLRGREWDKRMLSDRGTELFESVAKKIGGKVK